MSAHTAMGNHGHDSFILMVGVTLEYLPVHAFTKAGLPAWHRSFWKLNIIVQVVRVSPFQAHTPMGNYGHYLVCIGAHAMCND